MGNIVKKFQSTIMLKNNLPVVVILGCTGTGKSKLAIELAKKFNGEIISADSMQVYKGLDIITNKVTPNERNAAVHHCIDFLDPLQRYTVVDFRNKTLPIINKLLQEQRIPIIVGGTNYYIESLLWEVLIKPEVSEDKLLFDADKEWGIFKEPSDGKFNAETLLEHKITYNSLDNIDSLKLHKCLEEVDPVMANTLHPEDRRKVIRSLQVYQQYGCCHSELLAKQRSQKGGSSLGGPLRFKNTIMFWLQCGKEVLDKRLDDRVDQMIQQGMISELIDFHKSYNEKQINNEKKLYQEGIFQSIGFKEFHEYLILSEEEKESDKGQKILEKAIDDMKLVTRQYSRKQIKWVVNRFLKKPDRLPPPIYGLDATNLDMWQENVFNPAVEVVQSVMQSLKPKAIPLPVEDGEKDVAETHYCDICERVFVGRRVWEIHLKSRKHYKRKSSLRKNSTKELKHQHS